MAPTLTPYRSASLNSEFVWDSYPAPTSLHCSSRSATLMADVPRAHPRRVICIRVFFFWRGEGGSGPPTRTRPQGQVTDTCWIHLK